MKIYSWGSNSHGQLGQGIKSEQSLEPQSVTIEIPVKCIIGGGKHTVLVTKNGDLLSCGDNDKGQLSRNSTIQTLLTFEPVPLKFRVTVVSCGWDFTLALTEDQDVFGWGGNQFGQLGLPKHMTSISQPVKVFDEKATGVAAGLRHSAIISSNGFVFTTGNGRKGQLGIPKVDNVINIYGFTQVPSINNASKVSCGEHHVIVSAKKGIFTWGDNKFGQLGIDPKIKSSSHVPLQVQFNGGCIGIITLASGWSHNAVLTDAGKVITWGRNDLGQLGEVRSENWKPEIVKVLVDIKQLVLGSNHGVALNSNGEILCWGWNEHGNCGNGHCETVFNPQLLNILDSKPCAIGTGSAHSFYCVDEVDE